MISLLITTFLLSGVLSHEQCGFDASKQRALDNDKDGSLHKKFAEMEAHFESERHKHQFNKMVRKDRRGLQEGTTADWDGKGFGLPWNGILEIPVVVHVLYNPNYQINLDTVVTHERIQSQIRRLNKDYSASNVDTLSGPDGFGSVKANYQMSFKLHKVIRKQVTWNEYDFGANHDHFYDNYGGSDVVDPEHYLNLYVVVGLGANGGGVTLLGNCAFPGMIKEQDGCTINYKVFGDSTTNYINDDKWKNDLGLESGGPYRDTHGRTATHEIGHYFYLGHIWGEFGSESFDWRVQFCNDGDKVSDTPNQQGPNSGCPSLNDPFPYSCESLDMYMNFMDYSDGECKTMFTLGQLERTVSIMDQPYGKGRKELIDYQSSIQHSKAIVSGPFVNDIYFSTFCDTNSGGDVYIYQASGVSINNMLVYACASTTDNPFVDVIDDVWLTTDYGNNCIETGSKKPYLCYSKVPNDDLSSPDNRMTAEKLIQIITELWKDQQ